MATTPHLLWNLDETGFQATKVHAKVYVSKRVKNAYSRQQNNLKHNFTVLFCCSAAGVYLPPFIINKGKFVMSTHTSGGPPDAGYGVTKSGWMNDINFEAWFRDCFIPQTKKIARGAWQILTFDGHHSHITFNLIDMARKNNIELVALPPNTTHALQPLDVGVFHLVKELYNFELKKFYREAYARNVDKDSFPSLLKPVWAQLKPQWATAGFEKTGLHPLKPTAVDHKMVHDPRDDPPAFLFDRKDPICRRLIKTIDKAITPTVTPRVEELIAKKTGPRARVQNPEGEVLTEESSAQKVWDQEQAKKAKLASRGRGRGRGRGAAAEVTIQMKRPPKEGPMDSFVNRPNRPKLPGDGTLNGFVTKTTTADVHTPDEPVLRDATPAEQDDFRYKRDHPSSSDADDSDDSYTPQPVNAAKLASRGRGRGGRGGRGRGRGCVNARFSDDPDDPDAICIAENSPLLSISSRTYPTTPQPAKAAKLATRQPAKAAKLATPKAAKLATPQPAKAAKAKPWRVSGRLSSGKVSDRIFLSGSDNPDDPDDSDDSDDSSLRVITNLPGRSQCLPSYSHYNKPDTPPQPSSSHNNPNTPQQPGMYTEADTINSSMDCEEVSSVVESLPKKKPPLRDNLKVGSTHVIFRHEGAYFPGLVVKRIRGGGIRIKSMSKGTRSTKPTSWIWPTVERLLDIEMVNILESIKTPDLQASRGESYHVARMLHFWTLPSAK